MHKKLAKVLITIGNFECLEKAKQLESNDNQTSTLTLRNLSLKPNDITAIAAILNEERDSDAIKSISFSYNKQMGDIGATVLSKSLPLSLLEIGLVDCGIGDKGGRAILNFVKTLAHLKMICIEENNFSDELKQDFRAFKETSKNIIVVI